MAGGRLGSGGLEGGGRCGGSGGRGGNLGNGNGFSVLEVIKCCERESDIKIPFQIDDRRDGDPAVLVSENKVAVEKLNWNPKYNDISSIIKSAWSWHNS